MNSGSVVEIEKISDYVIIIISKTSTRESKNEEFANNEKRSFKGHA